MKKIQIFLASFVLAAFSVCACAQTTTETTDDDSEKMAVPPYPRFISCFISVSPEYQTMFHATAENVRFHGKEFGISSAIGATFQLHWEENRGWVVPFSVGYFRESKLAAHYRQDGKDSSLVQGFQISIGHSIPTALLPGLRFAVIGRAGKYGSFFHDDPWRNFGRKLYHSVGPDKDDPVGFVGLQLSYAFRKAPWGKDVFGYLLETGMTAGYGGGPCTANVFVAVHLDNPKKRLR